MKKCLLSIFLLSWLLISGFSMPKEHYWHCLAPQTRLTGVKGYSIINLDNAPDVKYLEVSGTNYLEISDIRNPRFFLKANLDKKGILDFFIVTKRIDADAPQYRSEALNGRELFEKMMDYFGEQVKGISSTWYYDADTLQVFNELIRQGKNPEEAALATWAGKQARKFGFSGVEIQEMKGKKGYYTKVKVIFYKIEKYLKGKQLALQIRHLAGLKEFKNLQPGEDREILRAGIAILSHPLYMKYLNPKGDKVREQLQEVFRQLNQGRIWGQKSFKMFQKLIKQIPTVLNPHEDLFVEVFDGFTREQLKILADSGYDYGLLLFLTSGCPNQCLICAMPKKQGKLEHMIFPMAAKILKHFKGLTHDAALYGPNEPLTTRDEVIGATIADYINLASENELRAGIVTHGLGGKQGEEVAEIVRRLPEFEISFHIYHKPVYQYTLAKLNGELSPEEDQKQRQRIIELYVKRFVPLIKEGLRKNVPFSIRKFIRCEPVEKMLTPFKQAHEVVQEIQLIQDEVWNKVSDIIGKDVFPRLKQNKQIIYQPVFWVNEAAKWLKQMGVPRKIIEQMRETYEEFVLGEIIFDNNVMLEASVVPQAFMLFIESDGSLNMYLQEKQRLKFRTIAKMFTSYSSKEFRRFVNFLKIALESEFVQRSLRENFPEYKRLVPFKELDSDLQSFIKELFLGFEFVVKEPESLQIGVGYVENKGKNFDYLTVLRSFFLSPKQEQRLKLLMQDLNETNLQRIYEELKDVPFPNKISCDILESVHTAQYFGNTYAFGKTKRGIFNTLHSFVTPYNAFSARSLSKDSISSFSPRVSGLGQAQALREVLLIAA